jgi:hypothetical protein
MPTNGGQTMLIVNTAKISPEEFAKKWGFHKDASGYVLRTETSSWCVNNISNEVSWFLDSSTSTENDTNRLYDMIVAGDIIKEGTK